MVRYCKPWIGKTDDSMPPPKVTERLFRKAGGCCENCGRRIMAGERWDRDHILALADGGANIETNYQILCGVCHDAKTKLEASARAEVRRMVRAAFGMKQAPRRPIRSRPFATSARRERAGRPSLPPRGIYDRPYLTPVGGLDRPSSADPDE
jgi:5-methylcytosine-specific restriction protein A